MICRPYIAKVITVSLDEKVRVGYQIVAQVFYRVPLGASKSTVSRTSIDEAQYGLAPILARPTDSGFREPLVSAGAFYVKIFHRIISMQLFLQ